MLRQLKNPSVHKLGALSYKKKLQQISVLTWMSDVVAEVKQFIEF